MTPEEQNIREQIAAGNMDYQPAGANAKHLCGVIDRLRSENAGLVGAAAEALLVASACMTVWGDKLLPGTVEDFRTKEAAFLSCVASRMTEGK